jgi:hypothetical protein
MAVILQATAGEGDSSHSPLLFPTASCYPHQVSHQVPHEEFSTPPEWAASPMPPPPIPLAIPSPFPPQDGLTPTLRKSKARSGFPYRGQDVLVCELNQVALDVPHVKAPTHVHTLHGVEGLQGRHFHHVALALASGNRVQLNLGKW